MVARALDRFIRKERLFVVHDNVFYNQAGEVICLLNRERTGGWLREADCAITPSGC